jgi:secernin
LHRRAMADYKGLMPQIRADFEALEDKFFAESESVRKDGPRSKAEFVAACWRRAEEAETHWIERLEARNYFIENPAYRAMWDQFNRAASLPLE